MIRLLSILLTFKAFTLSAQMPDTDLWLFAIAKDKAQNLSLVDGQNITNRPGYDNQPAFSPDGKKIYYVSTREDNQADIYSYDLKKKRASRVTTSIESEYSPVLSSDGKLITVVMVEKDSSQRIHFLNAVNGTDEKRLEFDSVGYYTQLNKDTVLYFKLTDPHSLRIYSKSTNEDKWIANSPARTFRAVNRNTFLYGIKDSSHVTIYKYSALLHKSEKIADCPAMNEDMVWQQDLGLIISDGSRLLRFNETKKSWDLLFELSTFGIKKITRFAFDPRNKKLVVVNNL